METVPEVKGLVSLIMPVYNMARHVQAAVESCKAQTYRPLEVIIVDDGSTDETANVLGDLVTIRTEHKGYAAAINLGCSLARGEFIGMQDADDQQDPTRIEKQMRVFTEQPGLDIVTSDTTEINDAGQKTGERSSNGVIAKILLDGPSDKRPMDASRLMRRSTLKRVGLFDTRSGDEYSIEAAADLDWMLRALVADCKFGHVQEPLYWRRNHPGQYFCVQHRDKQIMAAARVRALYRVPLDSRTTKVAGRVAALGVIAGLLPEKPTAMEIGVYHGEFSDQILKVLKPGHLHLLDPWEPSHLFDYAPATPEQCEETYKGVCMRFSANRASGQVIIHRGLSQQLLPKMPAGHFDFVYVDADHTFDATLHDLEQACRLVKKEGVIAGHDYTLQQLTYGVMGAVGEFLKLHPEWEMTHLIQEWNAGYILQRKRS